MEYGGNFITESAHDISQFWSNDEDCFEPQVLPPWVCFSRHCPPPLEHDNALLLRPRFWGLHRRCCFMSWATERIFVENSSPLYDITAHIVLLVSRNKLTRTQPGSLKKDVGLTRWGVECGWKLWIIIGSCMTVFFTSHINDVPHFWPVLEIYVFKAIFRLDS